jgi:hypothetical protein
VVSKYESGRADPPTAVLMHCMHILGQSAPPLPGAPASSEPLLTAVLPPDLAAVRYAANELRRAVDALLATTIAVRDTGGSHPPDSQAAAPGSCP